jgi:hypothetical protein
LEILRNKKKYLVIYLTKKDLKVDMGKKTPDKRDDVQSNSSGNVTKDKLKFTPFTTATEHKAAREKLLYVEWTSMTRADIRTELLINSDDCENLRKIFEEGVACSSQEQKELFRVYNDGYRTKVDVSPAMVESKEAREGGFKALVESTTTAHIMARLRAVALIDSSPISEEEIEKTKKLLEKLDSSNKK